MSTGTEMEMQPPSHQALGEQPTAEWAPHRAGGYQPVPQYPPPATGYAPAPPIFSQQQQSSNTAVVVNQPAPTETVQVHVRPHAKDYLILTVLLMVLCFIIGNLSAFLCLCPSLCFAFATILHNNAGDYEGAQPFGKAALYCIFAAFIQFGVTFLVVIGIIVVSLEFVASQDS